MNKTMLLALTALFFNSCSNSNSSEDRELALRERELTLKERELALKEENKNRIVSNDENPEASQTTYNSKKSIQENLQRTSFKPKTEEELREELYNKESANPKNYLSVDYDLTYKVLTGEDKISGRIYNYATLASFKDVELKVTYSSATDTELDTETYVIYEYVSAGSSIPFTIKTYSPDGTKKIGVKIKTAKAD